MLMLAYFPFTLLLLPSLILAVAYYILPCNHSLFLYIIIHYNPTCHALPSFGSIPHILLQISLVHEFSTSNNHSITPISLNYLAYSIQSILPANLSFNIFLSVNIVAYYHSKAFSKIIHSKISS